MDAASLLHSYREVIASWAPFASRKYGVPYDDALNELQRGFVDGASRWKADGGASLVTFCKLRAIGAVKDFAKSPGVRTTGTLERLDGHVGPSASPLPQLDGIESEEFWQKARMCLARRHPHQWLVLCLVYREGWRPTDVARYFDVSAATVSGHLRDAVDRLRTSRTLRRFVRGDRGQGRNVRTTPARSRFDVPRRDHCCVAGCDKPVLSRGRCSGHYSQLWRAKLRESRSTQ